MLMRERIARAICRANCPASMSEDAKACQAEGAWDMWLPEADAVLDAMREPTKEMLEAGMTAADDALDSDYDSDADGGRYDYSYLRSDAPASIYIAMLTAAATEDK